MGPGDARALWAGYMRTTQAHANGATVSRFLNLSASFSGRGGERPAAESDAPIRERDQTYNHSALRSSSLMPRRASMYSSR